MTAAGYATRFDTVSYPAAVENLIEAARWHPSSALQARPGKRPGPGLEVTHGGTPEKATTAAGSGVIVDTTRGGTYVFVIPTAWDITMPARPGAGTSRIDFVVAQIRDEGALPGDGVREVEVVLVSGTAGASPTAPTIPTGALALARLDVPASGTVAVSKPVQRTVAAGGILPVPDAAGRDAIAQLFDGLTVYREDLHSFIARVNGNWRTTFAEADLFTGSEGALLGAAPTVGTRKIIKQQTAVTTVTVAGGGFDISYHDGAFPNGIVSLIVASGDGARQLVPQLTNCTLLHLNGIAMSAAGAALAIGTIIRVNYIAIGW